MTETKQALDAVVALVEKATPGEWKFRGGDVGRSEVSVGNASEHWNREVICDDTFYYPTGVSHENMRAIAAAVSFIRTHGPTLQSALEQVEQLQAALGEAERDAGRYRWLREGLDTGTADSDVPRDVLIAGEWMEGGDWLA